MKYIKLFEDFITEKKPAGAPDWKDREDLMEGMNYDELVDDVVMKYNPALFSGEYTDLSNEERDLIKDMLKMYAKGHSTKEIAKKFTGKETELMNAAKVYTDDLIKRSLPQ
jgi:hypothetical protein